MQQKLMLLDKIDDLPIDGKRIMIGISGGINSAAVACFLNKYIDQTHNNDPKSNTFV